MGTPTTRSTGAPMTAAGGTLTPSPSMTGATTGGSPATSSPTGGGARRMTGPMEKLTGHATATGTGRTALASTGNPTTAPMTAAGGTPQTSTMTGPMTGGSPATSSTHERRATATGLRRPATTSGSGMSAGKHGGETTATSRASPTRTAGCTGTTSGKWTTGSPATSGGAPSASEHWISQGLRQQIMKWLRSHAISPVHAGDCFFINKF